MAGAVHPRARPDREGGDRGHEHHPDPGAGERLDEGLIVAVVVVVVIITTYIYIYIYIHITS